MAAPGQIKSPMPNMVKPEMVIAEKVANIASPATSQTMWDKLGGGSKAEAPRMSGGLSSMINTPAGTSKLQGLTKNLTLDNERYSSNLPNLSGPVKKGPGTAMQFRGQEQVSGGKGAGAQKGGTVFVDDQNWPVTLKEVIGSRMLSTAQLQKASIENVKKLISTGKPHYLRSSAERSVGSKDENEELAYMFQRMMLEGFVRGVDITKEIEKQGGLDISIKTAPLAANPRNIGLSQTIPGVDQVGFNSKFWRGANEAEKYQLFMHEIGHSLLNRNHAEDEGDVMKSGGTVRNAKYLMKSKDAYNSMLNEHFSSSTNKGTIAIAKLSEGKGTNEFDPSWFPQLSGEAVKVGGSGYTPGSSQASANENSDNATSDPADTSFNKDFEAFRADNQAQLNQMQESINQSMQYNAINSIPQSSGSATITAGGGGGGSGFGGFGPTMTSGSGNVDLSNNSFASGIANLR